MPLALLCAASLLYDAWTLKPNFSANTKSEWSLSMDVDMSGQAHSCTCDLSESVKDTAPAGSLQAVHLELANMLVDSNPFSGNAADGFVNSQNLIQTTAGDDADRQMYTPLLFVYPTIPVNVGDTWKTDLAPADKTAPKVTLEFTAKSIDPQNGVDALLVASKVKEAGPDALSADGEWWLDRSGKVLRFKVTAKNWHVSMRGGLTIDAVFTGKSKP